MTKVQAVEEACTALSKSGTDAAAAILSRDYPFAPNVTARRRFSYLEATRVFVRDGFIDRYSGERLVFPPVLRLLSQALPREVPYHPNWKASETHPAYWQVVATIDHRDPVALGGDDDPGNWITTSMAHNSAKMTYTLEELGLTLQKVGNFNEWGGLLPWSLEYADAHDDVPRSVLPWLRAGKKALAEWEER